MKYAKLTVVMRDEAQSKVLGIVNLENMGGQSKVSCGLRIPKFDYLQFTFNNGKVYFVKVSATGAVDVDFDCAEYCCSCVKDGKVLGKGHTSRFAYPNPQLIEYINEELKEEKDFFAEVSSDLDAFEGRVATYNYYEKELPKDVAQDAEKIVETVMLRKKNNEKAETELNDKKKPIQSKTKSIEKNNIKKEDNSYDEENRGNKIVSRLRPILGMPIKDDDYDEPTKCPMDTFCPDELIPDYDKLEPQKCPMDTVCPNYESEDDDYDAPTKCPMDTLCPDELIPDYDELEPQKCPMDTVCPDYESENDDYNEPTKCPMDTMCPDLLTPQIEENPSKLRPKHDFKDEVMKTSPQKPDFYYEIKEQLDHLFNNFKEDSYLNEIIPSSKWVKVTYDQSGKSYSVGLLTDGDEVVFIGYGVEGVYAKTPPKELNPNAQWVPLDFASPQEKGYWMIYQSAKDGRNL